MPELPDVEVFARNLDKLLAGRKLKRVKVVNGKKLADKETTLNRRLKEKRLDAVYRSGKEMRFRFGEDLLGLHLMLTGDIFIFEGKHERKSTIVEMYFDGGMHLALTDRMGNAFVKLDPVDKEGPDALSAALNFRYLKTALQRKTNIKKVLTDQNSIRGIGNSYSDEILWAAKISPYSTASAIPDEKIRELLKFIKQILRKEIKQIDKNYPGKINGEVKDFLKVHSKTKTKSPTGGKIIIDEQGMMKTYYTKEQKLYK